LLASTAPSHSPATRNLPLMSQTIPGYEYSTWYALYVPMDTPNALVQRINQALNQALRNPKLNDKVENAGTELHGGTPEDVLRWTQRDTEKWSRVIQAAKISVD
jgi:tripartite-type tricarboxylate transporter receptor subunit TctC